MDNNEQDHKELKLFCPKNIVSNTLLWCHGTFENNWQDSGWVWQGRFYPCKLTNDPNGEDRILGRKLLKLKTK